jgi:hypothetical protein
MSQYGCVQSARIWSKKFASIVTNNVCQLQQCKTDPCIFDRRDDDGKVVLLMAAYIDDEMFAGKRYAIEDVKRTRGGAKGSCGYHVQRAYLTARLQSIEQTGCQHCIGGA